MNVEILTYVPSSVARIGALACTNEKLDIWKFVDNDKVIPFCLESGHESVVEHCNFTFTIEGISRACLAQLTRHRIASFSVQSQRYVNLEMGTMVRPKSIDEAPDRLQLHYDYIMESIWELYNEMLAEGIPAEDARYLLPNACATNVVMTMNARELRHFFRLRLCKKAQWEIRELAEEMYRMCVLVEPQLFEDVGPPCKMEGCHEKVRCNNE